MTKEDLSRQNLISFIQNNRGAFKDLPNGDLSFSAMVIFRYQGQVVKELLNGIIHRTTWEGDNISLNGEKINAIDLHAEFKPQWQTYECTPENFLLIKDNSPKLGPYEVTIIVS